MLELLNQSNQMTVAVVVNIAKREEEAVIYFFLHISIHQIATHFRTELLCQFYLLILFFCPCGHYSFEDLLETHKVYIQIIMSFYSLVLFFKTDIDHHPYYRHHHIRLQVLLDCLEKRSHNRLKEGHTYNHLVEERIHNSL